MNRLAVALLVVLGACEFGGGPGPAGLAIDAQQVDAPPDAPPDAPGSGSGSGSGSDMGSGSGSGSGSNMGSGSGGMCVDTFAGSLASWVFTGQPGTEGSVAAGSSAPGIIAGAVSRSGGLSPQTGADSINSFNWSASATDDESTYYTFTIAPPPNCVMALGELSVTLRSSATGPGSAAIGTSADGFASTAQITPLTGSGVATTTFNVTNQTGTVELRIFGYDAMSSDGTMRIEATMSVAGTLSN